MLEDAESLVWCSNVICIPHPAFWRYLQAAVRQLLHKIGIPIASQPETDKRDTECAGIVCFAERISFFVGYLTIRQQDDAADAFGIVESAYLVDCLTDGWRHAGAAAVADTVHHAF